MASIKKTAILAMVQIPKRLHVQSLVMNVMANVQCLGNIAPLFVKGIAKCVWGAMATVKLVN